ncbi:MAG TPA: glycosyltransferase family 39 protein [Chloroflexia bacterium]|nr:glycosyltransferase family 39 protein [Chloroflexia bacterium]
MLARSAHARRGLPLGSVIIQAWPVWLAAIMLIGAAARFWNLSWDRGAFTFHPDERALNEVALQLAPNLNPHFFYYGGLPIYLYRGTAEILQVLTGDPWTAPAQFTLIGRSYSALAGTATILLVFVVGRRLWGRAGGLIAAASQAATALAIQAAHFGTVDSALTLAGVMLLWVALHIAAGGHTRWYGLGGVLLGLALATKLSAASFFILPLVAHGLRVRRGYTRGWSAALGPPLLLAVVALGTCLLVSPYYVLAWIELRNAIGEQARELNGGFQAPYTWQFLNRAPYLYEARNLLVWGLGAPLGSAVAAGAAWTLVTAARRRSGPLLLLVVWPVLYVAYIGTWEARYIRYLLPLVPYGCLAAAGALVALMRWLGRIGRPAVWAGRAVTAVVLLGAAGWGLALLAVYSRPDTRQAASAWVYANVPRHSRWLMEEGYQLLPLPDATHPPRWLRHRLLAVAAPDTPEKIDTLAGQLAWAQWLEIPDRRWSATLPRMARYPLTHHYYDLLFSGRLGYTPVAVFASPPALGPFTWNDDAAEETFQVFDHPTVRIFRNTGAFAKDTLRRLLQEP